MAQFFKAKPKSSSKTNVSLTVTHLDHLAAGISQHHGKVVFIPGALAGEQVLVQLSAQKKRFIQAKLLKVEVPSAERIKPLCPHFSQCGGCDLQFATSKLQQQIKQEAVVDMMNRAINSQAINTDIKVSSFIASQSWHYRRRAKLATWYDKKQKKLLVGFRAEQSQQVVPIQSCMVLTQPLSDLIAPLSNLLNQLNLKTTVGHVELLDVDNGSFITIRVTKSVNQQDKSALAQFAIEHNINILLEDNSNQFEQLAPLPQQPYYQLGSKLKLHFLPGNFIQVNSAVNQKMVEQAIAWLQPQADEKILDLFCGVGNFTLPLAEAGAQVIGVEGVPAMVKQAQENASTNNIDNAHFFHANLSDDLSHFSWLGKIDKLLLDPARAGAYESLKWLTKMQPKKVLYVSCHPVNLARDSQLLLQQGYQLTKLSVMDMFPQTHHVEVMALFEPINKQ